MTNHQECMINKEDDMSKLGWYQKWVLLYSDNPRRFTFFQSYVSVREEQQRQLKKYKLTIHPFSKFRMWYDIYLIYLYSSVLITKPIDSGFLKISLANYLLGYISYTVFTDVLCWIDIIINFMTGFHIKRTKSIELGLGAIAKQYLLSPYFFCDVASSIPKSATYLWVSDQRQYFTGVLGIMSLLKIIRLITLMRCCGRAAEYFHIMSKGLLFLFCSCIVSLLIIHWMACLQFAIPRLVRISFIGHDDIEKKSWFYQHNLFEEPIWDQYSHSFFRSSAYILCIRMNLYTIKLPEEYILAIITYFLGKILIAFIWIVLAVAILNSRSMDIKFAEIINQLEEYMRQRQLPLHLRNRILQYFTFKFQRKYFKEQLITSMLSEKLRKDVNIHVCKSLIRNVSIFSELNPVEIGNVVEHLVPEIFLPNDVIIQSGSHGDAMYFLFSGTVAVFTRSGKEICHLQDGAYFGEIALVLKNQSRVTTAIAIETTHVYRLNKKALEKCLLTNRKVMLKISRNAESRLKQAMQIEEEYKRQLFEQIYQKIST